MAKTKTSPKGIALYPRLNKPDTEYVADGVYHVKLKMDTDLPEVAAFIKQIDEWHEESKKNAIDKLVEDGKFKTAAVAKKKVKDGDRPYVYIEDEDGNDTSFVRVNFKMKAKVTSKKNGNTYTLKPRFFDAHKTELDNVPSIYSNSELRIAFTPVLWFTPKLGASVKLQMEAVQIIKLVSGSGGGNADDYGFGEEEEGFTAEETPFDDADSSEAEGGDDGDDDSDDGDF